MNRPFIFIVLIISVFLAANPLVANEINSGKVRSVLGEVTRQKKDQNKWLPLRVGAKVSDSDLIRTLVESQAIISLPDGSSITIEENAIVVLEKVFSSKSARETSLDIKSGRLHFDVQKQAGRTGSFKFKTGTATAAIRGTNGFIGTTKKGMIASLQEGSLEVLDTKGKSVTIKGGQTLLHDPETGFTVIEAPMSGTPDLSKKLFKLIENPKFTRDISKDVIDSLTKPLNSQIETLLKKSHCKFNSVPDTVYSAELVVQGKCSPGIMISIDGNFAAPSLEDSVIEQTISWEPGLYGEKKYRFNCLDNNVQIQCGEVQFVYADSTTRVSGKNDFTITTQGPIHLCESNALEIEGSFKKGSDDTELRIKIGSLVSENLIPLSENQKFFHSISISDLNKNWNESAIIIEMTNTKGLIKKDSIVLGVNKSCKSINVISPKIKWVSSDSLKCKATLAITNALEDETLLSTYINSDLASESYYKDNQNRIILPLKSGIHDYRFKAQDLAMNEHEISKTLGCFPKHQAKIQLYGGAKEVWRVPPPPRNMSNVLNKELRFSIRNIPENDTRYIKQVLVKKDGRVILNLLNKQITDLHYNIPIEVTRNAKNSFEIEVRLKSGNISKATKTYEVR